MKISANKPAAAGTVQRALISVFDKQGLLPLAQALAAKGIEILASGGTAKAIEAAGVKVFAVEDYTQSPEVLDGRVKTLHPKLHAGILADRRDSEHVAACQELGWPTIDLVVCNLYPFTDAVARGAERAEVIEYIDIGGPTLVRGAAKNCDGGVTVLVDPNDYDSVVDALQESGAVPPALRQRLAAKAFHTIAQYDLAIAGFWAEQQREPPQDAVLPPSIDGFVKGPALRYGENPQQSAALYLCVDEPSGVAHGQQLAGKELSYNNYLDLDAAYRAAWMLQQHGCAIVKHTNPCGLAQAQSQSAAFERALAGDPQSAFGSIIGLNQPLQAATAQAIIDAKLFVECIAAPGFNDDARALLEGRSNLRLVQIAPGNPTPKLHAHRIGGGMLVQQADVGVTDTKPWQVVSKTPLQEGWLDELAFAMGAVAVLKSNAIAVTKDLSLHGAGAGQMSRVDATEQALKKAAKQAQGGFLASDAFFPFDDSVRLAHQAGIAAVVQPGGSKRDNEVIAACDELGIAMVFTAQRHFRH